MAVGRLDSLSVDVNWSINGDVRTAGSALGLHGRRQG